MTEEDYLVIYYHVAEFCGDCCAGSCDYDKCGDNDAQLTNDYCDEYYINELALPKSAENIVPLKNDKSTNAQCNENDEGKRLVAGKHYLAQQDDESYLFLPVKGEGFTKDLHHK